MHPFKSSHIECSWLANNCANRSTYSSFLWDSVNFQTRLMQHSREHDIVYSPVDDFNGIVILFDNSDKICETLSQRLMVLY